MHNMVQPKRNSIMGLDITSTAITMLAVRDGVVCVELRARTLSCWKTLMRSQMHNWFVNLQASLQAGRCGASRCGGY